jgi:hypothetical protein
MTDLPYAAAGETPRSADLPTSEPPRRLREWTLNCLVAALGLTLALGLCELLVRLVAPQELVIKRPDVWRPADTLGWVHWPNVNTTINTGDRTVRFITDADGFRVGSAGRTDGAKRILLLGDSFMEALQVNYEQSLAGLLEARLTERLHQPVVVRNTGVGGWDPPQYLMEARRELGRERFDLVLVSVYLGNDIVQQRVDWYPPRPPAEVHQWRLPRRLSYGEWVDAVLYPFNDLLQTRSQLYVFIKNRSDVLLRRLGLTAKYFPDDLLRQEAGSPRWAVTAQILSDIRDVARAHGAPTLFMLIPAPAQVERDEVERAVKGFHIDPASVDLTQPDRLLTAAMHPHYLTVWDGLPDFLQAAGAGTRLYGQVSRHLSPEGHELIERAVEPLVLAQLGAATPLRPTPAASAR